MRKGLKILSWCFVLTIAFFFAVIISPTIDTTQADDLSADNAVVNEADSADELNSENETKNEKEETESEQEIEFSLKDVPAYSGSAYAVVNDNVPYFTISEVEAAKSSYESYSDLDSLGRCGVCVASVGTDIMLTEEREDIGSVKPTGWKTVKYNGIVDGNYLYNRCHLLGYQLAGENANTKNLITGTRYMNVEGMLPFENMVADYVKETGNHVLYRVTPIFEDNHLVAAGVLMEAKSVEDDGVGILFNVFCYNVQPGISIDYATGNSTVDATEKPEEKSQTPTAAPTPAETPASTPTATPEPTQEPSSSGGSGDYAVNGKNGKIHMVGECAATGNGSNAMSDPVYFNSYEEAESYSKSIAGGLEKRKCGNCW